MITFLYTQYCSRWTPRVTLVLTCTEKYIVIPIPILVVGRWCQCKSGKVKTHPGTTFVHILFESSTLCGIFRPCIQKNDDLIFLQELIVDIFPVARGIISKAILLCNG